MRLHLDREGDVRQSGDAGEFRRQLGVIDFEEIRHVAFAELDGTIDRLAGAPVELLWVKGVTGHTLRPCENVIKHVIDPTRPDLWFPIDCENCEPCEARLQHLRKIGVL